MKKEGDRSFHSFWNGKEGNDWTLGRDAGLFGFGAFLKKSYMARFYAYFSKPFLKSFFRELTPYVASCNLFLHPLSSSFGWFTSCFQLWPSCRKRFCSSFFFYVENNPLLPFLMCAGKTLMPQILCYRVRFLFGWTQALGIHPLSSGISLLFIHYWETYQKRELLSVDQL